MKKSLLLAAGLVLASATAHADVTEPQVMQEMRVVGMSPNGKWAVSYNDYFYLCTVIDLESGQTWNYAPDEEGNGVSYNPGYDSCISNDGIVVASSELGAELPYYWQNGEWHELAITEDDYSGYACSITPDGSTILGMVSKDMFNLDSKVVATVPVIWHRGADGTYGAYEAIPYPTEDWTGRLPTYALAQGISADGKVIVLDLYDYSGMVQEPYMVKQDAEGKWTVEAVHPELLNPDAIVFPDYPGEWEKEEPSPVEFMSEEEAALYLAAMEEYENRPEPQPTDFMTQEELEAYLAAIKAYEEDWENNPYPFAYEYMTEDEYNEYLQAKEDYYNVPQPDPMEYMTDDEIAAYQDALDEYQNEFDEWMEDFEAFDMALYEVIGNEQVPAFQQNSGHLSPNGRYFMMTAAVIVPDEVNNWGFPLQNYVPFVFDLESEEYAVLNEGYQDVYGTQVYDDGTMIGYANASAEPNMAVISEGFNGDVEAIETLIEEKDPSLYSWMSENMVHAVTIYSEEYNEETDEYETSEETVDVMITGRPVSNADRSLMATYAYNIWDDEDATCYYSYILPTVELASLRGVAADKVADLSVKMDKNGVITINGKASKVEVYDVNGRQVFSASEPASTLSTGLNSGVYVVKATGEKKNAVAKAIL